MHSLPQRLSVPPVPPPMINVSDASPVGDQDVSSPSTPTAGRELDGNDLRFAPVHRLVEMCVLSFGKLFFAFLTIKESLYALVAIACARHREMRLVISLAISACLQIVVMTQRLGEFELSSSFKHYKSIEGHR
jgi:hypothetical protein